MLINAFNQFIKREALFVEGDKVLLAVSGGIDSVVMAYLFHRAGFNFGIAHCNFQLRGVESNKDETFVKDLAKKLDAPFYSIKFDTQDYADKHKLSIQMAARELRYNWFKKILEEHHYQYIATAHHKDDLAETVLLNLVKGSVLAGLHGILPKSGNIIRPLLSATKEEISEYATQNKIQYREDKSNSDSKYQRNLIRNEVIPLLQKINPDLSETIYNNSQRRNQLEKWIEKFSDDAKSKFLKITGSKVLILISDLKYNNIPPEIFFQWIGDYGFNYSQIEELYTNLDSTESRIFQSKISIINGFQHNYRMLKDRESISIVEVGKEENEVLKIEENESSIFYNNLNFNIEKIHPSPILDLRDPKSAYLDADIIEYPLTIRKWKTGDSFIPYGLKGSKLISDFLTDLKLSRLEKENQLVICSGEHICWVVGKRIDDRFKVHTNTKKILKITF